LSLVDMFNNQTSDAMKEMSMCVSDGAALIKQFIEDIVEKSTSLLEERKTKQLLPNFMVD